MVYYLPTMIQYPKEDILQKENYYGHTFSFLSGCFEFTLRWVYHETVNMCMSEMENKKASKLTAR